MISRKYLALGLTTSSTKFLPLDISPHYPYHNNSQFTMCVFQDQVRSTSLELDWQKEPTSNASQPSLLK